MSVIQSDHSVPLGAVATLRLISFVERSWEAFVASRNARATERVLTRLSDGELRDIGLHRGEISAVAERLALG